MLSVKAAVQDSKCNIINIELCDVNVQQTNRTVFQRWTTIWEVNMVGLIAVCFVNRDTFV